MVFFFRGDMPYEDLRPVGWYHAIPQVGAVLFAAGWWSRADLGPGFFGRADEPRGLLTVLMVSRASSLSRSPRAARLFLAAVPPMTAAEADLFKIPELQRLRAVYLADEHARRQARALVRLEWVERIGASSESAGIRSRSTFGRC